MKTKVLFANVIVTAVLFSACNTEAELPENASLKNSINTSIETLATAVNKISSSSDFKLLSELNESANSQVSSTQYAPTAQADSINIKLADISGIYEYSPNRVKKGQSNIMRFFERTADNDIMIVKLPVEKVKNPRILFNYLPGDTTLTNNFEATVNNYSYTSSRYQGREYLVSSAFSIDQTPIGSFQISYLRNKTNGYNYLSQYDLASGYSVKYQENSGDTAVSVYSISEQSTILFEEKTSAYKVSGDNRHRERVYSLTIGNVQIVRSQGKNSLDSAKVYVNGILQNSATVAIIVNSPDSTDQSLTHKKRDIKITFDDGTSTTIRELTATTIDNISAIFKAVKQAYFATDIIDRIAWNIYYHKE